MPEGLDCFGVALQQACLGYLKFKTASRQSCRPKCMFDVAHDIARRDLQRRKIDADYEI
jgi:hypothetical protein